MRVADLFDPTGPFEQKVQRTIEFVRQLGVPPKEGVTILVAALGAAITCHDNPADACQIALESIEELSRLFSS